MGFCSAKCSTCLSSVYLCDEMNSQQLHGALTVNLVNLLSYEGERGEWSGGLDIHVACMEY